MRFIVMFVTAVCLLFQLPMGNIHFLCIQVYMYVLSRTLSRHFHILKLSTGTPHYMPLENEGNLRVNVNLVVTGPGHYVLFREENYNLYFWRQLEYYFT